MSNLPDTPEGVAFIVWIACLAAGYDPGEGKDRATAVIELYGRCLLAVGGTRPKEIDRSMVLQ
jgi:hypothetical protein